MTTFGGINMSLPVKGRGLPHKVDLEVVRDFHRCSNTATQLNGNFIPIVFKDRMLRRKTIHVLYQSTNILTRKKKEKKKQTKLPSAHS